MNCCVPRVGNVTTVSTVCIAATETSVGRAPWCCSVPDRWIACTCASPTIHSWSIGSRLWMTNRTGTPTGTDAVLGV